MVLVVALGGIYYYKNSSVNSVPKSQNQETSTAQTNSNSVYTFTPTEDTSTWKTYTDQGLSFKYPQDRISDIKPITLGFAIYLKGQPIPFALFASKDSPLEESVATYDLVHKESPVFKGADFVTKDVQIGTLSGKVMFCTKDAVPCDTTVLFPLLNNTKTLVIDETMAVGDNKNLNLFNTIMSTLTIEP